MILSDRDIRAAIENGDIGIDPYDPALVQPASLDLRLGSTETGVALLVPGEFILATTIEVVRFGPSVAGYLAGKSTWARRGLIVEAAGWFDPGFEGTATLELHNMSAHPIAVLAGVSIAQMVFFPLSSPAEKPYNGRYQNQRGVTPARQSSGDALGT